MFPSDTNVKHLIVIRRKKLECHPHEIFRHVNEFKLRAAREEKHVHFAKGNVNIIKKTLQKNLIEFHDKVSDAVMRSEFFHKEHDDNKCDNDVDDYDD